MNKVFPSAEAAVADIPSGSTLMLGGFGLCGIPENLIHALVAENARRGLTGLHTFSNNMGVDGFGMGLMLEAGMIASHTGSYVGENKLLEEKVIKGELDLRLIPQGTLAERIRAGGQAFPPSSLPPEPAPSSPKAKRAATSTAALICSNPGSAPTTLSSKPGKATAPATSSTGRPPAISTP
jgi:acyl CoA:acetate/3-ketoacid CoA transferase alpha subunit